MTYADKSLDENPLWNAKYHLRFALEDMITAYALDRARQPAEHYQFMAVEKLRAAAGALGFDLVKSDKPKEPSDYLPCTVVAKPMARIG